jgi:hypothetical protein
MKKIVLTIFLFIHVVAKAQFIGAPYIVPYPYITSNGTAVVSNFSCSTASTGTMTVGIGVFGVTQTITATVTKVGTYNISATSNGVTFSGTGTFDGTGKKDIILTASGIPTTAVTVSFNLNTNPSCSFSRNTASFTCGTTTVTFTYNGSTVTYGTVNSSGQCWLDRNLGAAYKPTTNNGDVNTLGDLFQWGRGTDGHQIKTSTITTTLSNSNTPGNSNYIAAASDWLTTQNDNLWQGVNGINNVCPSGFRLPTSTELEAERVSWSGKNSAGAFASPLKLTSSGLRAVDGSVGSGAVYWSSTVSGSSVFNLKYNSTSAATTNPGARASGRSVRCIKN